jgi:hypothetical protein
MTEFENNEKKGWENENHTCPTLILACSANRPALICGHRLSGTYMREQAEHF